MIKGMKVALALYSVRDEVEKDIRTALQKTKDLGYDGVEFAGIFDYNPDDIRKLLQETGLEPISAHVPITELAENPTDVVAAYKQIGCSYIAIPWLDEESRPGNKKWEEAKADIAKVAEECIKQGITPLYHNHDFEFVKDEKTGQYALDQLFSEITALQTEIDTCWVKVAGENPAAYVRKYKGRAPIVHLKDYTLEGEKPAQLYELIGADSGGEESGGKFELRPVGYGVQDVSSLVDAASYAGASWIVVEQDNPSMGKTPFECAEMSIEFLKTL